MLFNHQLASMKTRALALVPLLMPALQTPRFAAFGLHYNYIGGLAKGFGGSEVHWQSDVGTRFAKRYKANLERCNAIRDGSHLNERALKRIERIRLYGRAR